MLSLLHHPVTRRNCLTLGFTRCQMSLSNNSFPMSHLGDDAQETIVLVFFSPGSFTAVAIQHCFTTDLRSYSDHFYLNYYARVLATAMASLLIYLSASRCGRRSVLLFSAIATCLASLLLLAFNQSESRNNSTARTCVQKSRIVLSSFIGVIGLTLLVRPARRHHAVAVHRGPAVLPGPDCAQRLLRLRGDAHCNSVSAVRTQVVDGGLTCKETLPIRCFSE